MTNEVLRVLAPIAVLTAGIVGFKVFGEKTEPEQQEQSEDRGQLVETLPVNPFKGKLEIEFDGVVVPFRQIRVSAEIDGRVTFKSDALRSGRFVKAGTKLLEIDPQFHELEVKRLTAELQQAKQTVAEFRDDQQKLVKELIPTATRQVELEQQEFDRIELLKQRNVVTASEIVPYQRNLLTAQNTLDNLEKELQQLGNRIAQNEQMVLISEAKLGQAERDLKHSTLHAPIDGLVVEESIEEGSFVQRGTELFLVEDTSRVEISSNLTMDELGWLLQSPQLSAEGTLANSHEAAYQLPEVPVKVYYDLGGELVDWDGEISRLAGSGVDPRTRTIPCRVTVPEPREFHVGDRPDTDRQTIRSPRTLMNGMFVQMTAGVDSSRPVLALPEQAVHPGNKVWICTAENKLNIASIDVLHRQGDHVLILAEHSPFHEGDEVITSPLSDPFDGMRLRKKTEGEDAGDQKTVAVVVP